MVSDDLLYFVAVVANEPIRGLLAILLIFVLVLGVLDGVRAAN